MKKKVLNAGCSNVKCKYFSFGECIKRNGVRILHKKGHYWCLDYKSDDIWAFPNYIY